MTTLPQTVDDAYNNFAPDIPLREGEADPRYVDLTDVRGGDDLAALVARKIRRSDRGDSPRYLKLLFTGHRGCGKTTELFRLKRCLEKEGYFVVYFDVEEELDIADVSYLDVLVTLAQETEQQLRESEVVAIELKAELLENIARWLGETIITEEKERGTERTLGAEYGLGAESPALVLANMLAKVKGEIKSSSKRREVYRKKLERNVRELIGFINDLLEDAQFRLKDRGSAGLVVIVDGLEKVIYREIGTEKRSSHEILFIEHGEQLKAPCCHIVYTVPLSLIFDRNINQVFTDGYRLVPMVKIAEKDEAPCKAGREALYQVIARRADVAHVFEGPELVKQLVEMSGGHVRDLLHLVQYAFDHTDTQVTTAQVEKACQNLVNDYDRLVRDADLPRLYQVYQEKRAPTDAEFSLLLFNLLVLEYCNGEPWADVHPAVQATLKFQAYKKERSEIARDAAG
jgi:energy-coupling factor transporter ATP-binding protein EcfA2